MSKIVEYRGCTIQSFPCRIGDSQKWGFHIVISVNEIRSSDAVYATEQEAEIHGIAFGPRIIDGKVEGQFGIEVNLSNPGAPPPHQRHSLRC
jgi:hypothetical protein